MPGTFLSLQFDLKRAPPIFYLICSHFDDVAKKKKVLATMLRWSFETGQRLTELLVNLASIGRD